MDRCAVQSRDEHGPRRRKQRIQRRGARLGQGPAAAAASVVVVVVNPFPDTAAAFHHELGPGVSASVGEGRGEVGSRASPAREVVNPLPTREVAEPAPDSAADGAAADGQPPTVQPPTVQPPTVQPPTVQPTALQIGW
jgi:hypothetical protein